MAIGLSEVAEEGITVGICCLGHLSGVLSQQTTNPHFASLIPSIKQIATMLGNVCTQFMSSSHITVDSFDQCRGIAKELETLEEYLGEQETLTNAGG